MKKYNSVFTSFIAIALLSLTNTAYAEWKELGSNEVMTVYTDVDTISGSGNTVQILSMLDFKKPGVNPSNKQAVSSIVGLNEYNCPEISYRPIEFKEFAGNKASGKVVSDTKTPDSKFEPVIDGSWTAGVFKVVCKLQ
jgi:hypothetical protein